VRVNQARYPVATMCRVLQVSRSGYYAWVKRGLSSRAIADITLTARIEAIHRHARGTYGWPRVHAQLRAEGIRIGHEHVGRLMRAAELRGACRRKFVTTTQRDHEAEPAPDLVQRDFHAARADQLWVADITYVPTWAGFLYLAIVLDVFSRRIVGWAMENHLRTELVLAAIEMAYAQRCPQAVIHHSDHGCQYTSIGFGKRCEQMGVRPSMGSVGDCFDNAMAESFFASLECELLDRHHFRTQAEAKAAVFDYLEGFYNPHRLHSSLGYLSPADFERRCLDENRLH
jgi:putative transposase